MLSSLVQPLTVFHYLISAICILFIYLASVFQESRPYTKDVMLLIFKMSTVIGLVFEFETGSVACITK
jgi:TctA family transporter